jgi:very-short-patch-repair endonuclease
MTISTLIPVLIQIAPIWVGTLIVVVLAVVLRSFLESRLKKFQRVPASFEFNLKRKNFFTKSEIVFYKQLLGALHGQPYVVFPKVRLADLFNSYGESRRAGFNKLSQKHIDYLIVAMPECVPIVGIELDGPSHASEKQQALDADKDAAFKAAGLPLIRVRTEESPNLERLKSTLTPYLTLEARSGQQRPAEPVGARK